MVEQAVAGNIDAAALAELMQAFNRSTEALQASHERLRRRVKDLTRELAQKNGELARRRRLAALGEMAAGVAHEIRNPLGGIVLCATLLQRDIDAGKRGARELLAKIVSGVHMLDGIVEGLLAFASDVVPDFAEVELHRCIDEALALSAPLLEECGALVETRYAEPRMMLRADRGLLQRVFINLARNAAEAMAPAGGRIVIETQREVQALRVRFCDSGPGIPAHYRDKVFNPFFTRKDNGMGLGLSIVHRIVERHGGEIRVGEGPQGGALFSLRLPLQAGRETSEERPS